MRPICVIRALAVALTFLQAPRAAEAQDKIPLFSNGHDGVCLSCHADRAANLFTFLPNKSSLVFRLNAGFIGDVAGHYRSVQGGFILDPAKPERSAVIATVRADTVDTDDFLIDAVLTSEWFFDAQRYPFIVFFSRGIERTGERSGRITGDLTIRGVTRPITLDVTFKGDRSRLKEKDYRPGFTATGSVKRSDFGMTFVPPGTDEKVVLTIEAQGRRPEKLKERRRPGKPNEVRRPEKLKERGRPKRPKEDPLPEILE